MAYTTPERDMQRAKEMRKLARDAKDDSAKKRLNGTADRLERRASLKASKIGRKRKPSGGGGGPRRGQGGPGSAFRMA